MLLAAATAAAGAEPVPPGRAARPCVPRTVPAWRRHARELYDLLTLTTLESPTLCLAWRPGPVPCVDGWSLHHLLLGTDSAEDVVQRPFPRAAVQQQRNFLCVVRVALPDGGDYVEEEESGDRPPERSRPGEDLRPHVDTVKRVNHAGAVCAMTHLPQHPDFAVTGSLFGDLLVFDLLDCPAEAPRDGRCRPGARLSHHEAPCWSVAASAHEEGLLPSGASDGHLCLWDLRGRGATCGELAMGPRRVLKAPHGGRPVREVAFHPSSRCLLASVGDDGRLCVWDTRTPGLAGAAWAGDTTTAVAASAPGEHGSSCRALAFAPSANGLLATAGQDGTVRLWDLRRLGCEHSGRAFKASASTPLQLLAGHTSTVERLAFTTGEEGGLLVSSGCNGQVLMWDPRRAAATAAAASGDTYAEELVFAHAAHEAEVRGLAVTTAADGAGDVCVDAPLVASADAAGVLQVWRPSDDILTAANVAHHRKQ